MIITLAEGSCIVVADVSGAAHIRESSDCPGRVTALYLSRTMRRLTEAAEDRVLDQAEYARIHGIQHIGRGNNAVWAQEYVEEHAGHNIY